MAQAIASSSKLVFVDEDRESLKVWLDPSLPSFVDLAPLLRLNGGVLASSHADAAVLILSPKSITIFDQYCHPSWLLPDQQYPQRLSRGEKEWEDKVILTDRWPRLCVAAGRMMGTSESWGGCRKGGPPKGYLSPTPATAHCGPAATKSAMQPATPSPTSLPSWPADAQSPTNCPSPATANRPAAGVQAGSRPAGNSTQPASTRFPPHQSTRVPQYTEDEIDEILRNAHPMCLWRGMAPKGLSKQLHVTHPKLSASSWNDLYSKWLNGAGRFKPLAREKDYLSHVDLFQPYLPSLTSFAESPKSISDKLEKLYPVLGKSSSEWSILLGSGWLRNMTPDVKTQTPPTLDANTQHPPAVILGAHGDQIRSRKELQQDVARRRIILAKEFKAKYDSMEVRPSDVGRALNAKYGYVQRSVEAWYYQWRNRDQRFAEIPKDLRSTCWNPFNSTPAESIRKRKASLAQPGGAKRLKPSTVAGGFENPDIARGDVPFGPAAGPSAPDSAEIGPSGPASDSIIYSPSSETERHDLGFPPSSDPQPRTLREDLEYSPYPDPTLEQSISQTEEAGCADNSNRSIGHSPNGLETSSAVDPSSRLLNVLTRYNQSYTVQQFDEILRNAHSLCLFQGESPVGLGKMLVKSHPKMKKYTSWMAIYRRWLSGADRFQPLLQRKGYLAHVDLFNSHLPAIQGGATLIAVADELARKHSEHDYDTWNMHLGDWLRNMPSSGGSPSRAPVLGVSFQPPPPPPPPSEAPPPVPPFSPRPPAPANRASHAPRAATHRLAPRVTNLSQSLVVIPSTGQFHVLAEMFKKDYDRSTMSLTEVGREVALRTGHGESTCRAWFGHWLRDDRRYRDVKNEFRPTLPRPTSIDVASSSSTAERTPARPAPPRQVQAHFTNGEEADMVTYIHARQPTETEAFEEDWEDFAEQHPARTAADYAEHYGLYKARINNLLLELGGHVVGGRSSSFSSGRKGSASRSGRHTSSATTVVAAIRVDVVGKGKERVVVDLTISDEDD